MLDGRMHRRILGTGLLPGGRLAGMVVEVADGRIAAVEVEPSRATSRALRRDDGTLALAADEVFAPAFIDIHCHGAGGVDPFGGPASLEHMAATLGAHGVGAFVATLMTAPLPAVLDAAGARAVGEQGEGSPTGPRAHLLGFHLEGPALSPHHSGGHDPAALTTPRELLRSLRARPAAWSNVRIVTSAPELDGGLELVGALTEHRIVASVGHTGASADLVAAAYGAGARSTTHLFNGMASLHHRDPGPIGGALAAAPFIELICDGVHIDDRLLAPVARAVGEGRLLLVSDAVALAGSALRRVATPGTVAMIRGGRAVHPDGTLAGSRLLLDGMVRHAVATGIPLATALRAASENPAHLLGMADRGVIQAGARADLVVVSRAGRLRRVLLDRSG